MAQKQVHYEIILAQDDQRLTAIFAGEKRTDFDVERRGVVHVLMQSVLKVLFRKDSKITSRIARM